MAIATSSWTISANTNWISSTPVSTDPAMRLNVQINNWVTGIGSTSIINIQADATTATTKSSSNQIAWFLQTRDGDTGSDWGIIFHPRRADTSASSTSAQGTSFRSTGHSYYQRTPGSSNNGYGTFTSLSNDGTNAEDLSATGRTFVAYETSGPNPWFVYAWERTSDFASRTVRAMFRVSVDDAEAGSYYPGAGISKWIYLTLGDTSANIMVPIRDVGVPQKGLFLSGYKDFEYPRPSTSANTAGYFFRPYSQYGDVHYLGKLPLVLISNTSTGVWGDTITIDGVTYTCLGNYNSTKPFDFWIRTSD